MKNEFEKLHLGCGLNTPSGWLNVDGSWNARLAKYPLVRKTIRLTRILPPEQVDIAWSKDIFVHDVRSPLPFNDGSFRYIYTSHLLEHLYWEDGQKLLEECFRLLKSGGRLRIVVPDLKVIAQEYISSNLTDDEIKAGITKADKFNGRLLLRARHPHTGSLFYRIYNVLNDFHTHKWMYDADSLINCLQNVGFVDVHQMAFHDSGIPGIEVIEEPERVLNGAGICIEGGRPDTL